MATNEELPLDVESGESSPHNSSKTTEFDSESLDETSKNRELIKLLKKPSSEFEGLPEAEKAQFTESAQKTLKTFFEAIKADSEAENAQENRELASQELSEVIEQSIKRLDREPVSAIIFEFSEDPATPPPTDGTFNTWLCLSALSKAKSATDYFYNHVLQIVFENKQGGLARHLALLKTFLQADISAQKSSFTKITSELITLTEFLFNEIFPVLTNPDKKYSPEEVETLRKHFFDKTTQWIKAYLAKNAYTNKGLNSGKLKVIKISDFLSYDFETNQTSYDWKISKEDLNNVMVQIFIGNLIAKLEMALFFINVNQGGNKDTQGQVDASKAFLGSFLEQIQHKFKNLFANAMEIVRSQNQYIDFLRRVHVHSASDKALTSLETSTLFEVDLRLSLPFPSYSSFLCLYLLQNRVIKDPNYYHLVKPWRFVKLCLNLLTFIEAELFQSTPFFDPLFRFLLDFIRKRDLRVLENTNEGNIALNELLMHLRHMCWNQHSTKEGTSKVLSEIFGELYAKIGPKETRFRVLRVCLQPFQHLKFEKFDDIGGKIVGLLCEEVKKELALGAENSVFFRLDLFAAVIKILKEIKRANLMNLVDGIKELVSCSVAVIKAVNAFEAENEDAGCLGGDKFGQFRLGGVKALLVESKAVFGGLMEYLKAKVKDLKQVLSTEKMNSEAKTGKIQKLLIYLEWMG